MMLHKYKNYEEYVQVQTEANVNKLHMSWVDRALLQDLVKFVIDYNPEVSFGICHGTRRGEEQEQLIDEFLKYGKTVSVIGTEISHTAKKFPNTIQWDFHDVKEEWLQSVDFIYSNSLDHSYEPEKAIDAWMSCLRKKTGLCAIEHAHQHGVEWTRYSGREELPEGGSELWNPDSLGKVPDAFVGTCDDYIELIEKKYNVLEVKKVKGEKRGNARLIFISAPEE